MNSENVERTKTIFVLYTLYYITYDKTKIISKTCFSSCKTVRSRLSFVIKTFGKMENYHRGCNYILVKLITVYLMFLVYIHITAYI